MFSHSALLLPLLATLLQPVSAEWAEVGDFIKTMSCGATCNSIPPVWKETDFDEACNIWVNDGCNSDTVIKDVYSATFAGNTDIDCISRQAFDLQECRDGFMRCIGKSPGIMSSGPGGPRYGQCYVFNGSGNQVGVIGLGSICAPLNPQSPSC